jgi:S-DNA-T family DNA segregation ATPase FtsK/SpoIIIE
VQGRTGERFARRLALGALDTAEALHVGLTAGRGGGPRPAGRGTDVRSGHLCQVARHGTGPGVEDDVRAVVALGRRRGGGAVGPEPFRVEPLPTWVGRDHLAGHPGAIGLGDDLGPLGFGPEHLHVLVTGPRRSGRSTALRALARAWSAQARPVLFVTERPVAGIASPPASRVTDISGRMRDEPGTALLVDDVDHHADGLLESLVLEAAATAGRRGAPVAVGADSASLVTAFRGAAVQVATRRTGLLLSPRGAAEGDVLGVRVRGARGGPPGRGLLVRDGVAEVVQVVTDEPPGSSRGHEPPRAALR